MPSALAAPDRITSTGRRRPREPRGPGLPRPLTPIGVHGRWRPVPVPTQINTHDVMLLAEVASGRTIPVIGDRLGISERTVRRRLRAICDDLKVGTAIEAVAWAARRRLV